MKSHSKESYKHKEAKKILAQWLKSDYTVKIEEPFDNGGYPFRPDISVYTGQRLDAFYEVVHTSPPSGRTIGRMQMYSYMNSTEPLLHIVEAEYILCQCDKPEKIESIIVELIK